jgi:hypothetical protein
VVRIRHVVPSHAHCRPQKLWLLEGTIRCGLSTLMSDFARSGRVNPWLACKRWFQALPGKAEGAVVETTVDHTLMGGLEPHDR